MNYKEAQTATSEQRKTYAYKHLRIFVMATAIYAVYMLAGILLHTSRTLDIVIMITLIIVAAFAPLPEIILLASEIIFTP